MLDARDVVYDELLTVSEMLGAAKNGFLTRPSVPRILSHPKEALGIQQPSARLGS